jgi:hypothetical protein
MRSILEIVPHDVGEEYMAAARARRDSTKDEYDRLWWALEVETRCTLDSHEMHRRVMLALRKK